MSLKRRLLGMRYRAYVKSSFSMDQYLQRHTQQLHLGATRAYERIVQVRFLSLSKTI